MSSVGRPREHDEHTAAALLAAAERTIETGGPEALSIRGVATDVGTTTRAVYSLFGSKDGLIAALGAHGFDLLRQGLDGLPITDDPGGDLIDAALMFRRFALDHPALFAIGVQRKHPEEFATGVQRKHPEEFATGLRAGAPSRDSSPQVRAAANAALEILKERVARLAQAQSLGDRTVNEATLQFHALCEGLAAIELRGTNPSHHWERLWRQAFTALVAGFATTTGAHHPTRTLT
jgi:AcrR family transcriptional regulator